MRKEKIRGRAYLMLTKEEIMAISMKLRPSLATSKK